MDSPRIWMAGSSARDAPRGLDAVHLGHRDVHQDHVRPERMRLGDRLDAVGRLANDAELDPLLQHVAEHPAYRGVIIDDENLERMHGHRARGAGRRQADHGVAQRILWAAVS
jgi:hypothetical protein